LYIIVEGKSDDIYYPSLQMFLRIKDKNQPKLEMDFSLWEFQFQIYLILGHALSNENRLARLLNEIVN